MQLSEARVFEMMGRLHAENRQLADENERLRAAIEQHRCPAPEPAPKKKAR